MVPTNSHSRGNDREHTIAVLLLAVLAAASVYLYSPESRISAHTPGPPSESVALEESASETATRAMVDFALNLRTASEYTVYARRGIADDGGSEIRGARSNSARSERKTARELAGAIDAIRQLPCTEGGAISGRTFTAGVYCVDPAEIAGEVVIDGGGSADGVYIFRIAGTLRVVAGASIRTENGAQAGNIYFVAENAEIGDNAVFRANLLSSGDVLLGSGAVVTERVIGLGKVELNDSAVLGGTTGTMKICVEQPVPADPVNDLSNRIFHYVVTGAAGVGSSGDPVRVRVGTCSAFFDVNHGPQTVTQLNTGSLVVSSGGTFQGRFELIDVADITPASPSSLGLVNLATRVASVNVVSGGEAEQMTLRFTNRHAVTGFIDICHRASTGPRSSNPSTGPLTGGDADVTGFFQYTIEDVYSANQQNPDIKTLQVFTVPVTQCTGPIAVTKGDPAPSGNPLNATAYVSMLPRAGTYLEGFSVNPPERQNGPDVKGSIIRVDPTGADVVTPAPGGGYVDVIFPESASTADRTVVTSRARSNPARVKVCKVAGPGIPLNTLFRFTVSGRGSLTAAHPQSAEYGQVTRTFDVRAGHPAQGGTCEFVPGTGANPPGYNQYQTFVNGTTVTIVEDGISPNNTVAQEPGQLRVSQVRVFGSSFTSTGLAGFTPNPSLEPASDSLAKAAIVSRASIVEVEFVGYRFNPALLKVCSRAENQAVVGLAHTYRIAFVSPSIGGANPGSMFPTVPPTTVAVAAGEVGSAEGNCVFVNGSAFPGGAFNQGSTVTITVQGMSQGTRVTAIDCPSCGPTGLPRELGAGRATLSGAEGLGPGINAVVFTKFQGPICRPSGQNLALEGFARTSCPGRSSFIDFDGDGKSDPAVFSPSQLRFSFLSSAVNYQLNSQGFGIAGDRPVPADFDGDGRTDIAVWRPSEGRWYIQGSVGGFEALNWGEPGDVPLTGDYDGDTKSDLIIFRRSNATWYIRTRLDSFHTHQFGLPSDLPIPADYDGDGRTDVAVFRNGTWYALLSTVGFTAANFGVTGDVPVPGDYDGDGGADYAVFRPSNATWYVLNRSGFTARQYGSGVDVPVPADYDGDGKTDIAFWRRSTGEWYIRRSAFGDSDVYIPPYVLGAPTDIPLQAPKSMFWEAATVLF